MLNLMKAENLKFKRTFSRKLIFLGPLGLILLSFTFGFGYYQINAFNWWYTLIYPGCIALFAALSNQKDGNKKLKYQNLYTVPVDLRASWLAKMGVAAFYALMPCGVVLLGIILGTGIKGFVWQGTTLPLSDTILPMILGMAVVFLTSVWEIPLCFILAKKLGFLGAVLLNVGVGTVGGVLLAEQGFWFMMPYSWTSRAMCPVLGIRPNNLLVEPGSPLLDMSVVPVAVVLSLALCAALTLLCVRWFSKKEAA